MSCSGKNNSKILKKVFSKTLSAFSTQKVEDNSLSKLSKMAYYGNYDDVSCKSSQNNVTKVHMVKFHQKNVVNNYILCYKIIVLLRLHIWKHDPPVKKSSRGIRVKDILKVGAFTYPRGAVEVWQK